MEEVKKEETKEEEQVKKPITTLAEAKAERLLMQEQLDRREGLIVREELLQSEKTLSGTSEAGQPAEKPKEETDKEYSTRVMSGDLNE